MNSGKVRIYELSKELNLDNKDVLEISNRLNIAATNHASTISGGEAELIRQAANSSSIQPLTLRRTPRTGQGFIEPLLEVGDALPLHMVLIPAGTFLMGSPEDELERLDSEGPQHEVTVPTFLMGRYPVTQAQWRAVAALPQVNRELKPDPSNFKGDNRPLEQVSWYDAAEFCDRLTHHTQRPYRLPSEAEWEYACRAGTKTPFYFGKTLTTEVANYDGNYTYADGPEGEYREETTPVDHFGIANAFGLSDMHGNVWEWCEDHWHDNYKGAPTDGSAWLTDNNEARRINRGGSWLDFPRTCRSACRCNVEPDSVFSSLGFRVVCSAPRTL
jgi:formylglycine-generating enzyme required for sulfatase activity